jgi:hypothetical protein
MALFLVTEVSKIPAKAFEKLLHPKVEHTFKCFLCTGDLLIQDLVYWALTPCSNVVGYITTRCHNLDHDTKVSEDLAASMLVLFHITTWRHIPEDQDTNVSKDLPASMMVFCHINARHHNPEDHGFKHQFCFFSLTFRGQCVILFSSHVFNTRNALESCIGCESHETKIKTVLSRKDIYIYIYIARYEGSNKGFCYSINLSTDSDANRTIACLHTVIRHRT